ncbi:MAG: AraC family transcriptional regulator [Proteobacteria bacterium]|nr:AraC family transcriptional regulator [Pseudomonadota bacterium]
MRHPLKAPKFLTAPPEEEARNSAAVIPTTVLAVLAQVADEQGIAVDPWLAGMGLKREQIDAAATRISYRQAVTIIRRALRTMPDADIGLRVGSRQSLGTFGVLGLAMLTQRTFGEAMAIGIEHHPISGALMDLEFEALDNGDAALIAHPRASADATLPFLCEELFASSLVLCRSLLGPGFKLARLELTYQEPAWSAEYRRLFRCEVRFGAAYNRAVVDRQWMGMELPTHHPVSAQQALAICREQSASLERQSDVVASVERMLRLHLREHPRLGDIASDLNLSERTLRRHLAACGQVFRDIHDRIRTERALELLHAGALRIGEIGTAVGYSDPREFRRAFKRWTGGPPRAMRPPRHQAQ